MPIKMVNVTGFSAYNVGPAKNMILKFQNRRSNHKDPVTLRTNKLTGDDANPELPSLLFLSTGEITSNGHNTFRISLLLGA